MLSGVGTWLPWLAIRAHCDDDHTYLFPPWGLVTIPLGACPAGTPASGASRRAMLLARSFSIGDIPAYGFASSGVAHSGVVTGEMDP